MMNTKVDLQELAIDRSGTSQPQVQIRRHVFTRYMLPIALLLGFLALLAGASRDVVVPPRPVTVVPVYSTTVEVRQEGAPLFKAAGWIEPRPTPVRVAALAPGVVEQLLVVEDQPVKAGEPIAELVKADALLARDRALADLELREAELDEAKASLAAAETRFNQPVHLIASLSEAEALLAKVETMATSLPFEVRQAEADHEAMRKSYEGKVAAKGVVAGIEIDVAKSKADAAKALVEQWQERSEALKREQAALIQRRDALKTQLELLADETKAKAEAAAQVRAAAARVAQTKVAVAQAKLELDRMTVRAPIDGRVFRLFAHPGTRIGSSTTQMASHDGSTVVTMYRPDMLQVRVDVRFEDIPRVSLDQPVEINNPALSSPLTGKVLFISSEADIQKNTLQVKVEIPDPPSVFKPEMLVDVTFLSRELRDESQEPENRGARIFVPQHLIHSDGGESFVWLADQSEQVARKQIVSTGSITKDGMVEILRGLTISSRLVASGTEGLAEGSRIKITGEEPTIGTTPPSGSRL